MTQAPNPAIAAPGLPPDQAPLRSVHTNTLVPLLQRLGISLVVSTYQAGKLIVMRADGPAVNTHFRVFQKPMGLAATANRLALGTTAAIWEFHNIPSAAARVEPKGKHDACYIPRSLHVTGDIDIHEMAWAGEELWFINTRFSCLCTLDKSYSFVPRWRPPFITAYDLRDRCHLNGLAVREGQPRYVTALGETDSPNGWRDRKAVGGILIDVTSNEILLRGLSMPHSPRWYADRLWLLESGKGSLAYWDAQRQQLVTVAQLPGFTRGLDFCGDFAFVGLSQIRESAVFSGLPLTQTATERICGLWVVNIHTGATVAFLRFEEAIQEIFAVSVLPGVRFPEIVEQDSNLLETSYVLPDEALADAIAPSADWEFAETYFNQGNQLYAQSQLEAAIAAYRQCLQLQPTYLPARYNLGVTLGDLEQYPAAISELEQVVAAEARHAEAWNLLGFVCGQQLQLDRAITYYERALQIRPEFSKAHHNLGMTLLQRGDLERGWQESEWRWQTEQFTPFQTPHPYWDGQPIPDKTLLIHTEQGAGDAIQFIRYLPFAAERCGKILLVCPPNLMPIFQGFAGIEIRPPGQLAFNAFDTYLPLMSLPHVLKTRLDTIPNRVPYLQVPPAKQALWAAKLPSAQSADRLHVGFVWAGSPTHANDANRSCAVTDFLPVLQVPQVQFYSLQVSDRAAEIQQLPADLPVQNLSPQLQDYGDTAAAVNQLDLVITVDTSVAHLAGALGKPVWTALCYNPDWRWLLERDDSPWYPTMQLFRQPQPKDWAAVFENMAQQLMQFKPSSGSASLFSNSHHK